MDRAAGKERTKVSFIFLLMMGSSLLVFMILFESSQWSFPLTYNAAVHLVVVDFSAVLNFEGHAGHVSAVFMAAFVADFRYAVASVAFVADFACAIVLVLVVVPSFVCFGLSGFGRDAVLLTFLLAVKMAVPWLNEQKKGDSSVLSGYDIR